MSMLYPSEHSIDCKVLKCMTVSLLWPLAWQDSKQVGPFRSVIADLQHMRPKECVSEAKYFLAPHAITKDMCQAQTNADFDSCATYEYAAHINVQPLYSTHYLSPVALAAAATVDEPTGQLET